MACLLHSKQLYDNKRDLSNCRIPAPSILDLQLTYLECEWTLSGILHRVLPPENRAGTHPTCLLHSLHTPLAYRLSEYDFRDEMIDNPRVTNFRFSYKAPSSSEHRTLRDNYTVTNIWRYPRRAWMKIDPAPRPRTQLFTVLHQANNSIYSRKLQHSPY